MLLICAQPTPWASSLQASTAAKQGLCLRAGTGWWLAREWGEQSHYKWATAQVSDTGFPRNTSFFWLSSPPATSQCWAYFFNAKMWGSSDRIAPVFCIAQHIGNLRHSRDSDPIWLYTQITLLLCTKSCALGLEKRHPTQGVLDIRITWGDVSNYSQLETKGEGLYWRFHVPSLCNCNGCMWRGTQGVSCQHPQLTCFCWNCWFSWENELRWNSSIFHLCQGMQ